MQCMTLARALSRQRHGARLNACAEDWVLYVPIVLAELDHVAFLPNSVVVMFRSSTATLNLSFVGSRIGNNRLQERRHHRKDTSCAAGE